MTLWIQPFFGDVIELPYSPPDPNYPERWRPIYDALYKCIPDAQGKALHQLRLFHKGSMDLSGVKEGDLLHLLITERMVERWVVEYSLPSQSVTSPPLYSYEFWYSTLSWLDGRWGDPYEDPTLCYRTPLTLQVILREDNITGIRMYHPQPNYFKERYGVRPVKKEIWYPTLREALRAVQVEKRYGEEMTDKTLEHLLHLWGLYHTTNQHYVDQGLMYE